MSKDAGGELEDFEREGGRHHRGDSDDEELLAGEAVAELLVALAVDAFEKEELTPGAGDVVGDKAAEGGAQGGGEDVEEEFGVVAGDVADDDQIEGRGDGKEATIDEGECAKSPDTEGA